MPLRPRLAIAVALLTLSACGPAPAQSVLEVATDFAREADFNGVVLIANGDSVRVLEAFGHAVLEDDVATAVDTRYQLGSVSKWISTLVVLSLADSGVLDLDAPISTYLPALPRETGRRVTLHHLVTHTSGVPNDFVSAYADNPAMLDEEVALEDAVRRYASGDLLFAPGAEFDYSHSNWILVKAIVESATGQPFEAVLEDAITGPLGLGDTGVFTGDFAAVPGSAVGYESVSPVDRNTTALPDYAVCMGGLYSTATDLLTLVAAVYDGDLLSPASRSRLTTVVVHDEGYAYGGRMHALEIGGRLEDVVWLTGSNGPFKSRLSRVLEDGTTVITLSNTGTSPEETGAFTERVLVALEGEAGR